MILVDVYIPAMEEVYDFQLDENASVELIIQEMVELIARWNKSGPGIHSEDFALCHMGTQKLIRRSQTLYNAGVHDGSRLILL